jgi:L-amino acid N-acyltransferase YncA
MSNATIRLATPDDAAAVAAIYAPFVVETAVSFEMEPPTAEEMRRRMVTTLERFPWLVFDDAGAVAGYAYAGRFRDRVAYQWTAEVTVYTHPDRRRHGVGRALYAELLRLLELQGICTVVGGITLPNAASVGLHEAMGFRPVGVFEKVGFKFGAWHDVGFWQQELRPFPESPPSPRPIGEVIATPEGRSALVGS